MGKITEGISRDRVEVAEGIYDQLDIVYSEPAGIILKPRRFPGGSR